MSRRFYVATQLERAAFQRRLASVLSSRGWELTYDWAVHGSVQSEGPDRIREVALAESKGVAEADVVVVLLPGARGTHTELGMAIGLGKPIVLHAEDEPGFLAQYGRTCGFYHHPLVRRVQGPWETSIASIVEAMEGAKKR